MIKKVISVLGIGVATLLVACEANGSDSIYDAFLNGEIAVETSDGNELTITELMNNDKCFYIYEDVVGDKKEELCVAANSDTYLIKDFNGTLRGIYEGASYDMPINTVDYTGMFYCYFGQAPRHERYKFTKFDKDGNVTSSEYASWYDANENKTMDENDWFFLDSSEANEVEMDKWLESAEGYLEMKNTRVDWQEMKLIK